jgi:hypothetical protein
MEDPQKRNNWKRVRILYNGNRRFRKARWRKGKTQGQKTKSARRGSGESAMSSLFSPSSSPVVRCIVVHSAVYRRTGSRPVPRPVFRLLIPPFQNAYHYAERLSTTRKGIPCAHSCIPERLPLCGTTSALRNGTGTPLSPSSPMHECPKIPQPSFTPRKTLTHLFLLHTRLLTDAWRVHWDVGRMTDSYPTSACADTDSAKIRIRSHGSTSFWTRKRVFGNLRFPSDNAWYGHWCQVGGWPCLSAIDSTVLNALSYLLTFFLPRVSTFLNPRVVSPGLWRLQWLEFFFFSIIIN